MKNRNRLLRRHNTALPFLQNCIDCLLAGGILYVLTYLKTGDFSTEYIVLLLFAIIFMFSVNQLTGLYRCTKSYAEKIKSRFKAWSVVILLLFSIGFLVKCIDFYSREVIVIWVVLSLLTQIVLDILAVRIYKKIRGNFKKYNHALIIGDSKTAAHLANSINNNVWLSHRVIGYVDDSISKYLSSDLKYLGDIKDIVDIVRSNKINRVYVTLPMDRLNQLDQLHRLLLLEDVYLHWVPDMSKFHLINYHVKEISGLPIITLSESPLTGDKLIIKNIFDRVLAVLILIPLSLVMLAIAVAVKVTSKGPVFFKQKRHGWNNKVFYMYKFRTMKVHQEKEGQLTQATKNDSRLTPIGGLLRRLSLDELPQIFNVLNGDMSLVGPRPHAVSHNEYYAKEIDNYLTRHKIKPGMTGLAQVMGFRGETDTLDKMNKRVQQDINYINNWSISLDLEILFKTIKAVIITETAY